MKKLFQIILAVAIVGLVYVIYVQISTPIRFDKETKAKKAQVIDRIKDIRTAQRAFKSKYQHFTASFDSLSAFVLTDTLELERKIVDEDDSAAMAMLKKSGKKNIEKFKIAVIDTIFAPKKVTRQDVENFRFIPGTGNKAQFIMEAGIITTESKVVIPRRGVPRTLQGVPRHGGLPSGGDKPDRRRAEQLQPLSRRQVRINGFR